MESRKHNSAWVRVNAQVDKGIAEIVSLLSEIDQLETVESCEGYPDSPAFVYLHYGDWEQLCRFMFVTLEPELHRQIGTRAVASVEVFNGSKPLGKISFDKESIPIVALTLKRIRQSRPEGREIAS